MTLETRRKERSLENELALAEVMSRLPQLRIVRIDFSPEERTVRTTTRYDHSSEQPEASETHRPFSCVLEMSKHVPDKAREDLGFDTLINNMNNRHDFRLAEPEQLWVTITVDNGKMHCELTGRVSGIQKVHREYTGPSPDTWYQDTSDYTGLTPREEATTNGWILSAIYVAAFQDIPDAEILLSYLSENCPDVDGVVKEWMLKRFEAEVYAARETVAALQPWITSLTTPTLESVFFPSPLRSDERTKNTQS